MNYARVASKPSERNLIHLKLFRANKDISYNLTKKEKASLLFRKMKLPPASVKSFEASNFERLTVELQGEIDVEKYKFSSALKIREGLSVMPMKELKRTTRIKVCWVSLDVPDEEIVDTLSIFGKVSGNPEKLCYEVSEEERTDEDLYNLSKLMSGERAVEIEIERKIPSYVKIAGKRARIWHPAQDYTCGYCYKSHRVCSGKADRAECKRMGGEERTFDVFWEEVLARTPRGRERMASADKYETDTVELCHVPEEVTDREVVAAWIREEEINVETEAVKHSGYPGMWVVTGIATEELMREVIVRLSGKKFGRRNVLAMPIRMGTPRKVRDEERIEHIRQETIKLRAETDRQLAEGLARDRDALAQIEADRRKKDLEGGAAGGDTGGDTGATGGARQRVPVGQGRPGERGVHGAGETGPGGGSSRETVSKDSFGQALINQTNTLFGKAAQLLGGKVLEVRSTAPPNPNPVNIVQETPTAAEEKTSNEKVDETLGSTMILDQSGDPEGDQIEKALNMSRPTLLEVAQEVAQRRLSLTGMPQQRSKKRVLDLTRGSDDGLTKKKQKGDAQSGSGSEEEDSDDDDDTFDGGNKEPPDDPGFSQQLTKNQKKKLKRKKKKLLRRNLDTDFQEMESKDPGSPRAQSSAKK